MFYNIIKLLLFNVVLVRGSNQWRCDYDYYEDGNGWFKYHEIPTTWQEAYLRCYYEGARLASPTIELIDTMTAIMNKNHAPFGKMFTGIHATHFKRDFSSIEGIPLSKIPHKWEDSEPDNKNNQENCITLNQKGMLGDVNCESSYPYICYKKNTTFQLNKCGTTDNEYFIAQQSGHCYKFHRDPHNWFRAYMICQAEGGYLIIINSQDEMYTLLELLNRNPPESLPPTTNKDGALVGFRYTEDGEWFTIEGQTLSEAGFDRFKPSQINNETENRFCGINIRKSDLSDINCETPMPFICEKDPKSLVCD